MTAAAATVTRAAIIDALKADAGVQATAMGASPRVVNRVKPGTAFPYAVVSSTSKPLDDNVTRGQEHSVEIRIHGQKEGDKEGEAIFEAFRRVLRDLGPLTLSDHTLYRLEFKFEDVRPDEDGKTYVGLQRWRAVTEER